jgi:segregation and condensation protein A
VDEKLKLNLANFSGPLDLLLYLIKSRDLDILEVSLLEVCQQYLSYLDVFHQLDINRASSYLAMASELLHLKTQIVCQKELLVQNEDVENELEDVQQFKKKLLDYQALQEAASSLEKQIEEKQFFPIELSYSSFDVAPAKLSFQDPYDLAFALEKVLLRLIEKKQEPLQIKRPKQTFSLMKHLILRKLKRGFVDSISELLKPFDTIESYLVGFLTVLELLRLQKIYLRQKEDQQIFSYSNAIDEHIEAHGQL